MKSEKYEVVLIENQIALLTYSRLSTADVDDKLYKYDIQSTDNGLSPSGIRQTIIVNHWGSLITRKPLLLNSDGWLFVKEFENFKYLHQIRLSQDELKDLSESNIEKIERGVENDKDQIHMQ